MQPSLPFRCLHLPLPAPASCRRPRALAGLFLLALVAQLPALLLCPQRAAAQLIPQRQWAVFRQSQGLLSNDTYAVLADGDAIWFGADKGINRYNGRWQSFPISLISRQAELRSGQPAPGKVIALAKANDGKSIWMATTNGYVARWDGDRWQFVATVGAQVHAIADIGGVLWLATQAGLVLLADGAQRHVEALAATPVYALLADADGVWVGSETGLWRLSADGANARRFAMTVVAAEDDSLSLAWAAPVPAGAVPFRGPVHALWSDGAGSLWLGAGLQVVQLDPRRGVGLGFRPFEETDNGNQITAIAGKPGESLWIASNGAGVVHYMIADGKLAATSNLGTTAEGGLDADEVRSLALDQDGTVWFTSPVGVFRYQQWAWLEPAGAYDNLPINDLAYDRTGSLWVATEGEGVQRRRSLYARVETFYPEDTGLPSEFVTDLDEDQQGRLWAGTRNGLALFAGDRWSTPLASSLLPSPQINAIKADKTALWIATPLGLARYVPAEGRLQEVQDFAGEPIARLELDQAGRLWVAPQRGGLWLHTADGKWLDAVHSSEQHAPDTAVTALYADPHAPNGMYAAFLNAGIYHWTGEAWVSVDQHHWPQGDRVLALALEPSDNSLWIGSEIGLSRLDELSLTTYDAQDGMQNGGIRAIVRDATGAYWFGGQKGLSHYAVERTPPWLRIDSVSSEGMVLRNDMHRVFAGRPVEVSFSAGDIQSAAGELRIFYRINHGTAAEPWREVRNGPFELRFSTPDVVNVEVMARDQSFNYSQAQTIQLAIAAPPATLMLPVLGEVEERIFRLLLLFAGLALVGFGYVTFEILQHHVRATEAVRRGFNPYISGEPVRREEMFFGRHDLLDRIVSTLHNNSIMIHGERRIGKTTLLYQLANALRQVHDEEYWFLPVMIDLEGTTEQQLFTQLMEEILQVVGQLPDLPNAGLLDDLLFHSTGGASATGQYTDREFGRDLRQVVRLLEAYCREYAGGKQVRLILLLDEGDTLSQFNHLYQQQLRRIFMRDFAATVGAVVAGIQISKEWDRVESPWYNLFNEIAMTPFTRAQAIELLIEPVRGYYLYEPEAIEFILAQSEGRPFRIQQYALEAVNHMLRERRRRITRADVEYAHELILATSAAAGAAAGAAALANAPAGQGSAPSRPDCEQPEPNTRLFSSAAD